MMRKQHTKRKLKYIEKLCLTQREQNRYLFKNLRKVKKMYTNLYRIQIV